MAQYQGSARSSGFDAINVPDNAQRVRDAGQKRIDELRRTYNQTIQNQKGAADELQQSHNEFLTAQGRNDKLQATYEKTYEAALRERFQQKIDKGQKQAELERDRYERLSTFSKEAGKLGKEMYDEYKSHRQRMGMALIYNTGLTAEELQTLRRGEDGLASEHAATNAIIARLKKRNASASEIKQIQELDGWILLGAQKELARKAGHAYRIHLNSSEVKAKEHDLGDGRKMSLQKAFESGDINDYTAVRGIISSNFLSRYEGYDLAFMEEYVFPDMRQADESNQLEFSSKQQEQFEKQQTEQFRTGVANMVAEGLAGNKYAWENFVKMEAGTDKGPALGDMKRKALEHLAAMMKEGYFESGQLTQIQDMVRGQLLTIGGKTVTFEEQNLGKGSTDIRFFNDMDKIVYNDEVFREKQEDLAHDKIDDTVRKELMRQIRGDGLSTAEVNAALKEHYQLREPPNDIQNLMTTRSIGINRELQKAQAEYLVTSGTEVTEIMLMTKFPALTFEDRRSLLGMSGVSKAGSGETGLKSYMKSVEQEIRTAMKTINDLNPGTQAAGMIEIMRRNFPAEFAAQKAVPANKFYSDSDIAELVEAKYLRQINANKGLGEGIFRRKTYIDKNGQEKLLTGNKAGFVDVGKTPDVATETYRTVLQAVNDDVTSFQKQKLLGEMSDVNSWASDIPSIAKTGQPKEWLTTLARTTGIPWKQLFNAQASLYNPEYKIPLNRLEDAAAGISPGFMNRIGVPATVTAVAMGSINQSRAQGAQGIEVYRPLLELIASYESSNDTVHGGYDAMNLGGTHGGSRAIGSNTGAVYFQKPLIEMTLGEIMEKQFSGQLHAAGRYQFLGTTLQDVLDNGQPGGISLDSKFDQATQDKLAVAYIRMTLRAFPSNPAGGIRGRWIGVKDHVSYEELQQIIDRIQNNTRVQGTAFANCEIDPAIYAHCEKRKLL